MGHPGWERLGPLAAFKRSQSDFCFNYVFPCLLHKGLRGRPLKIISINHCGPSLMGRACSPDLFHIQLMDSTLFHHSNCLIPIPFPHIWPTQLSEHLSHTSLFIAWIFSLRGCCTCRYFMFYEETMCVAAFLSVPAFAFFSGAIHAYRESSAFFERNCACFITLFWARKG